MQFTKLHNHYTLCIFSLLVVLAMQLNILAQPTDSKELRVGNVIKSQLKGEQKEEYYLRVESNQLIYIVVNQMGVDVVVTLRNSQHEKILEVDSPNGKEGQEPIFCKINEAGNYTLEISSLDPEASLGKYEIFFKELKNSDPEDEILMLAEKLLTEANTLRLENKSLNEAAEKYRRVLTIYEKLKLSDKYTNSPMAEILSPIKEANILTVLGRTLFLLEEYEKSANVFEKALLIFRENGNILAQAECLGNIGEGLKFSGDKENALKYYLESLALYRQGKDQKREIITNNNIGSIYDLLGNKREARQYYLEALRLAEPLEHPDLAAICGNLGLIYEDLEEHQKALNYHQQSLAIYEKAGSVLNVGIVLSNIGATYDNLGDYPRALNYYDQAIQKFEATNAIISKAKTLINKGVIYSKTRQFSNAKTCYEEALNVFKNKGNVRGIASVLTKLASLKSPDYSYEQKLSLLAEALKLRKDTLDLYGEAYTHLLIGNVLAEKKEYSEAEISYQNSLKINRRIGDQRGEIATLYELAKLHKSLGNLDIAKQEIEKAIDMVELSRISVDVQSLRTTYFAQSHSFYDFYIDLLMSLSKEGSDEYAVSAFEFSEKSRSRSFLDSLSQPTTHSGSELISLQRSQQSLINHKINQLILLKKEGVLEKIPLVEKEIDLIRVELEKTEAKVRSNTSQSPNSSTPLSLRVIQEKIIDSNTVLFEYFLGENQSFLWVIKKNSINTYFLPRREIIEKLAKKMDGSIRKRTNATKYTEPEDITEADAQYIETARKLSDIILQPFLNNLNERQIIVVTDECLNYISFNTLPIKAKSRVSGDYLPMISKFEIINILSASSLIRLREKTDSKSKKSNTIAIIADPIFDSKDERISKKVVKSDDVALRAIDLERGGISFKRLPFTETEGTNIGNLAIAQNYKCDKYFGINAQMKPFLERANIYRMIHFATHGASKNFHNGLSAIIMSLLDENGNYIDGILSTDIILGLNLNADLVVLSACNTGLGENFAGEGTVGIARSFMYAGAKSVIVSLWPVDDAATSELMKRFYIEVFKNQVTYSEALRLAQVSMLTHPKWKDPFFWGAFIIQGECK